MKEFKNEKELIDCVIPISLEICNKLNFHNAKNWITRFYKDYENNKSSFELILINFPCKKDEYELALRVACEVQETFDGSYNSGFGAKSNIENAIQGYNTKLLEYMKWSTVHNVDFFKDHISYMDTKDKIDIVALLFTSGNSNREELIDYVTNGFLDINTLYIAKPNPWRHSILDEMFKNFIYRKDVDKIIPMIQLYISFGGKFIFEKHYPTDHIFIDKFLPVRDELLKCIGWANVSINSLLRTGELDLIKEGIDNGCDFRSNDIEIIEAICDMVRITGNIVYFKDMCIDEDGEVEVVRNGKKELDQVDLEDACDIIKYLLSIGVNKNKSVEAVKGVSSVDGKAVETIIDTINNYNGNNDDSSNTALKGLSSLFSLSSL